LGVQGLYIIPALRVSLSLFNTSSIFICVSALPLRDLAGLPVAKKAKAMMPEINSEVEAVESEDNVITVDAENQETKEKVVNNSEQLFVDALMGRRKL
jgi:hypothetical protein